MPVFFSFDFEAQGPNYTTNGVNGLGIVIFDEQGNELECYETGIQCTNGRQMDPNTKSGFWDKQPEALNWINNNLKEPWVVVQDIINLYKKYKQSHGKVVWIAWPAAYDWGLMVDFYNEFKPNNSPNIGFKAECMSTLFKAYCAQTQITESDGKEKLDFNIKNPHFPGSDARTQGKVGIKLISFFKMKY